MAELPDELWRRVMKLGISISNPNPNPKSLTFKDLCSPSISCRGLHRLSSDDSLWSSLLFSDFPSRTIEKTNDSYKSIYKTRFEKDKRIAAHRRAVLRIESTIAESPRWLQQIQNRWAEEDRKFNATALELSNLLNIRQATVALNVWQPEVVRGRHKQMVEQCAVPIDSRINALSMEFRLCKQQLMTFDRAYNNEKQRIEVLKERLAFMKYHPLKDVSVNECGSSDHSMKRRKRKRCAAN